jgi:hypothetical protein
MQRLKQTTSRIYDWLELRLQLEAPIKDAALHPVPRDTASWWYVFGSAAFTLLFLQIFTGILLALVYVPSAGEAWSSLNVLNHQIPLGWFCAPCTDGDRTSWSPSSSSTWRRCFSSAPTNFPASSPGLLASFCC